MAHNLGHILLYRPFLHYLARGRDQTAPDPRQLRCAIACVKTSRQTITRSHEMLQLGFLAPAAWQPVYTIFLSIVALVFYLATQQGAPDYHEIEQEARTGVRILASTSCQDIGSRRCLDVLKVLARRLEHIIQLDIEGTEKRTASFCQADPSVPAPAEIYHSVAPPAPSMARRSGYAGSPSGLHSRATPTHPHQHLPQPPILRSSTDPSMARTPVQMPAPATPQPATGVPPYAQSLPSGHPAMMQQRMAATAANAAFSNNMMMRPMGDDFLNGSHSGNSQQLPAVDMEVPFSETFAWPFDPTGQMNQAMGGVPAGGSGSGSGSGHGQHLGSGTPLTSEDIAAFMMRINPGEEPFL